MGWLGSHPPKWGGLVVSHPTWGWVGSNPPEKFPPFTKNYGGGQPLRRILPFVPHPRAAKGGAQAWLEVLSLGGLPPLPPWLPAAAESGALIWLVVDEDFLGGHPPYPPLG